MRAWARHAAQVPAAAAAALHAASVRAQDFPDLVDRGGAELHRLLASAAGGASSSSSSSSGSGSSNAGGGADPRLVRHLARAMELAMLG